MMVDEDRPPTRTSRSSSVLQSQQTSWKVGMHARTTNSSPWDEGQTIEVCFQVLGLVL